MAKRKKKAKGRRGKTTDEQKIQEMEARLDQLRALAKAEEKFSPEAVMEERDRLELSAADYGELVGVSPLTIYNWEKGKSRPQAARLEKWLAVKGIGKREAWRRLGLV